MTVTRTAELALPYPYHVVFETVLAVLQEARYKLGTVDPAQGVVFADVPVSLFSWGEHLTIRLGQAPDSAMTQVSVTSNSPPLVLVDWGRGRRNVARVVQGLTRRLPPTG